MFKLSELASILKYTYLSTYSYQKFRNDNELVYVIRIFAGYVIIQKSSIVST